MIKIKEDNIKDIDDTLDEFEKDIYDPSNIDFTELKLNPDFYIHITLIKATSALTNPDVKAGFLQYVVLIENMESVAKSCNRLPDNYENIIKEFEKTITEKDELSKRTMIAKKKLELILTEIFKHKTSTNPIKL